MNICINAFCFDSQASLAPFDPFGTVQEVVASEKYGKPPGMKYQEELEKENVEKGLPPSALGDGGLADTVRWK